MEVALRSANGKIASETMESRIFAESVLLMGLYFKITTLALRLITVLSQMESMFALFVRRTISWIISLADVIN